MVRCSTMSAKREMMSRPKSEGIGSKGSGGGGGSRIVTTSGVEKVSIVSNRIDTSRLHAAAHAGARVAFGERGEVDANALNKPARVERGKNRAVGPGVHEETNLEVAWPRRELEDGIDKRAGPAAPGMEEAPDHTARMRRSSFSVASSMKTLPSGTCLAFSSSRRRS